MGNHIKFIKYMSRLFMKSKKGKMPIPGKGKGKKC
jgi:hypothetical protein